DGRRSRMLNQSMDQPGLPARVGHSISVDRDDLPPPDLEAGPERLEAKPQVVLPKVAIPPVVVSPDHDNGNSSAKPGQGRCYVKPPARDDAGVGEPEVEEVAVDEQAIAELRHHVEKLEE